MISDDINDKIEDELDDDFEVDEDFDDGFEEDWDEDDGEEALNAINDIDPTKAAIASGEKTFLQKFFIPIVVIVIAFFGGLFFLGQGFLSGSAEDPSQPVEEAQIPAMASETNDMPSEAPQTAENITQPVADVLPALPEDTSNNATSLDEQPLRPMPTDDTSDQSFELVDLEAELTDTSAEADIDTGLELIDSSIDETLELEDNDPVENNNTDILDVAEVPALEPTDAPIIADTQEIDTSTSKQNETTVDVVGNAPDVNATETVSKDELDKLANENIELQNEIKSQETTIEALRNQVNALKKDLETAKNDKAEAIQKAKAAVNTAKSEPVKAETTQQSKEDKPQVNETKPAPKKVVRQPVSWVLKSAQPGKATIAETGSGDLKTIEIGQKVSGLGQIMSIQIENGLWVVRGSKKTITQ